MRSRAVLLAILLSSAPPAAAYGQQAVPQAATPTGKPAAKPADVVVTGTRLNNSEKALNACVARNCPPTEDIAATLEHAKNLFISGEYRAARSVLLASRGRNFRYRKELPERVGSLVLANAIVAGHLGEARSARFETIVALDIVKEAFPANDPRVLKARLELAYQRARAGDLDEAITQFRAVENLAAEQPAILGNALLAQIMIADRRTAAGQFNYAWVGARAKKLLLNADGQAFLPYIATLRILEAKRAAERGDRTALEAALAVYRRYAIGTNRPILIFQPALDLSFAALPSSGAVARIYDPGSAGRDPARSLAPSLGIQSQSQFEKQWIDVGFWINPDGTVNDPAVLRSSSRSERFWEKGLLKAISGRRYAPFDAASQQFAPFRIERFTYTADYGDVTQTRVRVRSGAPKIESIDLTGSKPAAKNDAEGSF